MRHACRQAFSSFLPHNLAGSSEFENFQIFGFEILRERGNMRSKKYHLQDHLVHPFNVDEMVYIKASLKFRKCQPDDWKFSSKLQFFFFFLLKRTLFQPPWRKARLLSHLCLLLLLLPPQRGLLLAGKLLLLLPSFSISMAFHWQLQVQNPFA